MEEDHPFSLPASFYSHILGKVVLLFTRLFCDSLVLQCLQKRGGHAQAPGEPQWDTKD